MKRIDLITPDGDYILSATIDNVLELIWTHGELYWNSPGDTGFATLSYMIDGKEKSNLVFSFKDGVGFHFTYTDFEGRSVLGGGARYTLIGCNDYDDVLQLNLCDGSIYLPRAYFVTRYQAEQVVKEFFQAGSRFAPADWKPDQELDWDIQKGRRVV